MTKSLYDTDFHAWTQQQAAALRAKDWAGVDIDNVAEEIESLGRSDRRSIRHQLERLLMYLLKWRYQPRHRTPRWWRSMDQARQAIADLIEESPSLQDYPAQQCEATYTRARRKAARETGLPLVTFPERCPWPVDEILTEDWYPEAP
jgi:Domain of unknown function DUF29